MTAILLLQISVIQRSKANHNLRFVLYRVLCVVANISYSKIESKSQRYQWYGHGMLVVANISYSKIESKSQHPDERSMSAFCCCKYQLFKDRKQITTGETLTIRKLKLLQISVIQRSKANHNDTATGRITNQVVANISYSKIESKSQLLRMLPK